MRQGAETLSLNTLVEVLCFEQAKVDLLKDSLDIAHMGEDGNSISISILETSGVVRPQRDILLSS